jgi:hypothetical protein
MTNSSGLNSVDDVVFSKMRLQEIEVEDEDDAFVSIRIDFGTT